jgi:hypothetical protein
LRVSNDPDQRVRTFGRETVAREFNDALIERIVAGASNCATRGAMAASVLVGIKRSYVRVKTSKSTPAAICVTALA